MKKITLPKFLKYYVLIVFCLFSKIITAQSSEVTVSVNWPQWSGENSFEIIDPSGTSIYTYCDPSNCSNGQAGSHFKTLNLGCLSNDTGYNLILRDTYGDGWNGGANITITSDGNSVYSGTLGSGTFSSSSFNVSGGSCASTPEINVLGSGDVIDNNSSPALNNSTDFGLLEVGTRVTRVYTIENLGGADLVLTGTPVDIIGDNATDYNILLQPGLTISPGNSESFTVEFSGTTTGTRNAILRFASNDSDESTYSFNITAQVVSPVSTVYYENFDAGSGGWNSSTNSGFRFSLGTVPNELGEGNYWYTDNWNNYPRNRVITLTSPVISTVGYTDLKFYLDFRTNTVDNEDGMRVQYSLNGGTSWNTLGSDSTGENWYNSGDVDGFSNNADAWTGDSSGNSSTLSRFEEASHELPVLANNNPLLRFRIAFASDGNTTTDDGVLFDNIIVTGRKLITDFAADGPADVKDNLTLWLRSQDIVATDGTTLPLWEDIALDNDAFEIPANAPTFTNNELNNINFNSTVAFDRSQQQHLRGKGGYNSNDYWIVVRSSIDMTNQLAGETMLLGAKISKISPSQDPSGLGWGPVSARYTDPVLSHSVSSFSQTYATPESYGRAFSSTTRTFDDVHIINVKNNPANNQTEIFLNGRKIDNQNGYSNFSSAEMDFNSFTNRPFYIGAGRYQLNGLPFETHLDGEITEIFSYRDRKSSVVQQKIYSYLAIKNGVSLNSPTSTLDDHQASWDYLDSDGNIIWDYSANTNYNFDVAAIARDDQSELMQKQSKSENSTSVVAIGLNRVENLGSENMQSFENDRDFLFWGHNGQDLNAYNTSITHDVGITNVVLTNITRINRVWKIEERTVTDIAKTEIRVKTSDFGGLPALSPNKEYVLLIADDENFTTNLETRFFSNDGIYERATYNFDDIKYFTLAITEVKFEDRSVSFDGINDNIIVDNPQGFGGRFSASAWVLSEGLNNTNTERTIVAKRSNGTGFQLSLNNDNKVILKWNSSSSLEQVISNTALNNGNWRHIGITYDGSITKIYIDGVLDKQAPLAMAIADGNLLGIGARIEEDETSFDHFRGEIDEIRMWDIVLTQDQIRFIMNQELTDNAGLLNGSIIPNSISKYDISGINWEALTAYYSMNSFIGTSLNDESVNRGFGRMANEDFFNLKSQTAPLPYKSSGTGDWENNSTWINGSLLYTPGSTRVINGSLEKINWNIVKTNDEVTITSDDITLLGLFVESNEIKVDNDHGLTITHVLDLQGSIDLIGESQLVQITDSDLLDSTTGFIERDQQGTGVSYDYNYWSSPVSRILDNYANNGYTLEKVLKDGTLVDNPRDLNWTSRNERDGIAGNATTAATISGRWLYKYGNLTSSTYSNWTYIGKDGFLKAGEGFTMKGTGSITNQNYVFKGKPNNGDITLPIGIGNDYLIGNPYPSALDAHEFIIDNPDLDGTLYFWEHWGGNSHVLANYQGGYAMYNYSGGTSTATIGTSNPDINQGGIATKRPERFIPVSQGFFVTGISTGTIRFENDQRQFVTEASGNSLFVAAPGSSANSNPYADYNTINDLRPKIRLGFDSPTLIHRQLLLTIDPNASLNYDHGFDGVQIDEQQEDMAFVLGDKNLSIQGIDAMNSTYEIPLMVKVQTAGSITIKLDDINNIDPSQEIFLKDAVASTYTNLMNGDYVSPNLPSGINDTRFSIVFANPNVLSNEDIVINESDLIIYTPNDRNTLNVKKGTDIEIDSITMVNMLGQQVQNWDVSQQDGIITVNTENIAQGNYVVILDTNYGKQTRKVIIQ